MMKKATQEEAVAETYVFWDMNMCPVPLGCDPSVVRGCIKRLLERNGYCGSLTVTALGKLGDVPRDMLRGVYSSGIALANVPRGSSDISCLIDLPDGANLPSANYMLISDQKSCDRFSDIYQIMYKYVPLLYAGSLETLINENSKDVFEEEETTGELPLWDCLVCARDPPAQGFANFTTHLDSEEHHELMSTYVPPMQPEQPHPSIMNEFCSSFDEMRRCSESYDPPPTIKTPSGYLEIDWERVKSEHETFVFWDVNLCPVPPGFDASLVGPCIKSFLKKKGCFGPLTITAIGQLTDIPTDMLRKVYSSGIILHNVSYGPLDTANLLFHWYQSYGPLFNIMVISTAKIFPRRSVLLQRRFNLLKPFPNDSRQIFSLADSGALEKNDQCSETGDSAFWACSVCDDIYTPKQGFESFTTHLSGTDHRQKLSELLPLSYEDRSLSSPLSEPPEINLEAITAVFWDMKMCPVPPVCDPGRVGSCIKRFLENKGYSGPLNMTAFGVLTDVPIDMLRGVYSSGFALNNGFSSCSDLIEEFTRRNPPPANIMVLSDAKVFSSDFAFRLQATGYNLIQPCLGLLYFKITYLIGGSRPVEEDMCSETPLWICKVCSQDGKGFENFTNHVTSRRHERELLDCLPRNARFLRRHGDKAKVQEVAWECSVSRRGSTPILTMLTKARQSVDVKKKKKRSE